MNFSRVTKGNFNLPRVAKPRLVGIVIDLSDKWRIHHPYPFSFLWNRKFDLRWFCTSWQYWKINFGLIMRDFWGQFFHVLMSKKKFFSIRTIKMHNIFSIKICSLFWDLFFGGRAQNMWSLLWGFGVWGKPIIGKTLDLVPWYENFIF